MFLVLAILLAIFVIPEPWGWLVIGIAALAEVVETVVWMRILGREPARAGPEALFGVAGRVTVPCYPDGEVRVRGEAWRARSNPGADLGEQIVVRGRDGIVLLVEPASLRPTTEPSDSNADRRS